VIKEVVEEYLKCGALKEGFASACDWAVNNGTRNGNAAYAKMIKGGLRQRIGNAVSCARGY